MNRHERRTATAAIRKHATAYRNDQINAIHEAGHAVGHVLAAGEMGYNAKAAITCIDMGLEPQGRISADGKMVVFPMCHTFGPAFSKEIVVAATDFWRAYLAKHGKVVKGDQILKFCSETIKVSRTAGADIEKWFRARAFISVAGLAAEAKFLNLGFGQLSLDRSTDDGMSIVNNLTAAQMDPKRAAAIAKQMELLAAFLFRDHNVWAAVEALAEKTRAVGRVTGEEAVTIITRDVPKNFLAAAFGSLLAEINKVETKLLMSGWSFDRVRTD